MSLNAAIFALAVAGPVQADTSPAFNPRDLTGAWTNASLTGLERPGDFKTLVVPAKKAEAYERILNDPDLAEKYQADMLKKSGHPKPPDVGDFRSEWFDHIGLARIHGQYRSSEITYPKDGQLPYTKAAGTHIGAVRKKENRAFDNPEDRPIEERCVMGIGMASAAPLGNAFFNAEFVVVQAPDAIAIEAEMNHDVRVIRLNAKHGAVRQWMGDSIGQWRGKTLWVESTNFTPAMAFEHHTGGGYMLSDKARVTEWFTRTSPTEIFYRFRVEDPKFYKKPWGGEMVLSASHRPMLEYACHEGNYSLRGILAGARKVESEGKTPEAIDGGDPPKKPDAKKTGKAAKKA